MRGFTRSLMLAIVLTLIAASGAQATDLSGHWKGRWESFTTGHNGPLRCTLTRIDATRYQADFSGRFFKLIPFRYSVVLYVQYEGEVVTLSGQNYLGRRFGTFHYWAEANRCSFVSSYNSCRDRGQFVLERCCSH